MHVSHPRRRRHVRDARGLGDPPTNTGENPLASLGCCAPAYGNDDTVLTGG